MKMLNKQKLSDMAADEIINFILDNKLKPKEKLPTEKEISEKLGISRASVREGLMKLESLGLLKKQQGYGIFINEVTIESYFNFMKHTPLTEFINMEKQDVLNLLDIRFSLESDACLKAAIKMNAEELEILKSIHNDMNAYISDPAKFIELDIKFHGWLIKLSGNNIINFFYSIIGDLLAKQFQMTLEARYLASINEEHKNIVEAMIKKDQEEIMTALDAHFKHVREILELQL